MVVSRSALIASLLLAHVVAACTSNRSYTDTPLVEVKKDAPGMIWKGSETTYWIVPDSGTRLLPDDLPDEFEVDSLRVIFSGEVHEKPRAVKMMGRPFVLTSIVRDTSR